MAAIAPLLLLKLMAGFNGAVNRLIASRPNFIIGRVPRMTTPRSGSHAKRPNPAVCAFGQER